MDNSKKAYNLAKLDGRLFENAVDIRNKIYPPYMIDIHLKNLSLKP